MPDYWLYWIGLDSYTEKYIQVFWKWAGKKNQLLPTPGALNPERLTSILCLCNGVFTSRSIFR